MAMRPLLLLPEIVLFLGGLAVLVSGSFLPRTRQWVTRAVAATALLRALDLDGLAELEAVLEGSDVQMVLSGHYHHAMTGAIGGVPVHVAPGVTNVVDPLAEGAHEQSLALSGASVVELGEGAPRVISAVLPAAGGRQRPMRRNLPLSDA